MRRSERILIAVDVLLQSKSSFMSVFLMAFMMKASLSDSPQDFVVYCIVRYAIMGVLSVLLIPFFKKHPLVAWRSSMVFLHSRNSDDYPLQLLARFYLCYGDFLGARIYALLAPEDYF